MPPPPLQNFVDQLTVVKAAWLNPVDIIVTTVFEQTTTKPTARAALVDDLTAVGHGLEIVNGGTGATDGLNLSFRGVDSGVVNAYTVTTTGLANPLGALPTGTIIRVAVNTVNTGPATLTLNGFGPFAVVDFQGNPLTGGELTGLQDLFWTSTAWQMRAGQVTAGYKRTQVEITAGVTPVNYAYAPMYVERYGAVGDGITDDTAAFTKAASISVAGGGPILINAKTYLIQGVSLRGNNTGIIGPGSALCTLKQNPSGFGTGGMVEVGNTAAGNSAINYKNFTARGFTIDGNRSNISAPVDDLHGHGMPLTNITDFHISDVRAINCWNAGIGLFLNNHGSSDTESYSIVEARVYNCGNANAGLTPPGFDINAYRQVVCDVVSEACNSGARILNNCSDILGRISAYNSANQGAILQNTNASGNFVTGCNLDITVNTCGNQGLLMQEGIKGNSIRAHIANATGAGCQLVAGSSAATNVIDNFLEIHTENGQSQGILMAAGSLNRIIHRSKLDGRGGAAGSFYALDVTGNNNVIDSLVDGDAQVRSFSIRATSTNNKVLSAMQTNCLSGYSDSGTGTSLVPVTFETTLTGTYNLTSGAAPTVNTVSVTGLAFADQCQVAWPSNLQGAIAWAYVSAAGTLAVAAYNITGGALNFGSVTVTVRITKAAVNEVL